MQREKPFNRHRCLSLTGAFFIMKLHSKCFGVQFTFNTDPCLNMYSLLHFEFYLAADVGRRGAYQSLEFAGLANPSVLVGIEIA